MTDHADLVRDYLDFGTTKKPEALAALDALVAERDRLRDALRDARFALTEIADPEHHPTSASKDLSVWMNAVAGAALGEQQP